MRKEDFNILLKERINEIEVKMAVKGDEYITGDDVFSAFKKATAISFHNCPEQIAWEYMTKHIQSIKDMIEAVAKHGYKGYPDKDILREKFGDAINYLLILELMLLERSRTVKP
jgi:hypothetical protein